MEDIESKLNQGNSNSNSLPIHSKIKSNLDEYVKNNNIPNILFYGENGCGKKHLLNYLFENMYRDVDKTNYIMSVNCAFGKGIQFIRNELKFFSKTMMFKEQKVNIIKNKNGQEVGGNTLVDHRPVIKSVILFNAEYLTIDAQSALRRSIEIFNENTRFFIVVKDKTNILNPIQSRFHIIHVPYPIVNVNVKKSCLSSNKHYFEKYKCKTKRKSIGTSNLKSIDLYHYKKSDSFDTKYDKKMYNTINKVIHKIYTNTNTSKVKTEPLIECAQYLYNKGVVFIDIIEYIKSSILFPESCEKYELLIKLDNLRYNIRMESVTIYFGLVFIHYFMLKQNAS